MTSHFYLKSKPQLKWTVICDTVIDKRYLILDLNLSIAKLYQNYKVVGTYVGT